LLWNGTILRCGRNANKAPFTQNKFVRATKPAGSNALSVPFLDTHVQKNGQSRHDHFGGWDNRAAMSPLLAAN
jgi:hypothetical protein